MNTIQSTDYRAATTTSKLRIYGGRFGNEWQGIPWITMDEELLTEDGLSGQFYHNQCGALTAQLTDPTKQIELRNPLDDSLIGAATLGDVMVSIYSLGRSLQMNRDALLIAQQAVAAAQTAYDADLSEANLTALQTAQAALAALQG